MQHWSIKYMHGICEDKDILSETSLKSNCVCTKMFLPICKFLLHCQVNPLKWRICGPIGQNGPLWHISVLLDTDLVRQQCIVRSFSDLVVVTDKDVNGWQQQLKHCFLVTLFHLKTEALQEAGWTLRTFAAAVLDAQRKVNSDKHKLSHEVVFRNTNTH